MGTTFFRKLPTPKELKAEFPIEESLAKIRDERAKEIAGIFEGKSDKFLLIIGPCSADNEDAVLDYMTRLRKVADEVSEKIFIIPRVYTNKPRTVGLGYKGMLHQPDPEKPEDMLAGIIAIRDLHTRVLRETGFTCADEMLYSENHRYLSDLLGYVAIGARSVEDQQHRLVASGVTIPAGMKNPTAGDLSVMMNSIIAAQAPHTFIYRGWEVQSSGNPLAHAILRGYVDRYGRSLPNYHYEDLRMVLDAYQEKELQNPAVIVDANHANSGKQYLEQSRICKDILHSRDHSEDIRKLVKGVMVESYLVDGRQDIGCGTYGQSITDPCIGWEKTEKLIHDLADLL
ncbi:3-deoxy-D-arabinoheptulosonate-7-phosphate synthase [Eubacterium pyruvativorans]|uniref:Phospho-2-dehydro-3-deoxyheptonate aldolase n=1 Tax=Eubacterium pyruvativorans TaxID=155865 RepID=A0A1I7FDG8_9FIRM|nr:3-deoxy-7-phosphoheptulonate synthase [Eubacterium pyruvativorans]MCI5747449.1 3-deoxy-7-phosphoheptulonate synthase [Eubacterium pyruvativorans]MDD6708366.1 3-deoxy-7-phosphoheptulonate synthase [Eubacterium pyruvativorans]MDD7685304.1 3-deoxy-7-phosphoheptulonate synthase [Eubacterium pyruvativorans]MDY4048938.1 3-deoxy-7-phosphoheptulonate synthase [Eubacterium pyruvativorans]SDE95438.1 3-deoxy-D-arabinoheptulosonate-7-phosphate synthase [Eubacterium pyruvativorans]